jgi:hypothetical protein
MTLPNDIRIFAEIVDAPRLCVEGILDRAARYRADGADVIDLGCLPRSAVSAPRRGDRGLTRARVSGERRLFPGDRGAFAWRAFYVSRSTASRADEGPERSSILGREPVCLTTHERTPIRVRLQKSDRERPEDLARVQLMTPKGPVRLGEVARFSRGEGVQVIEREDRSRQITAWRTPTRSLGDIVAEIKPKSAALKAACWQQHLYEGSCPISFRCLIPTRWYHHGARARGPPGNSPVMSHTTSGAVHTAVPAARRNTRLPRRRTRPHFRHHRDR